MNISFIYSIEVKPSTIAGLMGREEHGQGHTSVATCEVPPETNNQGQDLVGMSVMVGCHVRPCPYMDVL